MLPLQHHQAWCVQLPDDGQCRRPHQNDLGLAVRRDPL